MRDPAGHLNNREGRRLSLIRLIRLARGSLSAGEALNSARDAPRAQLADTVDISGQRAKRAAQLRPCYKCFSHRRWLGFIIYSQIFQSSCSESLEEAKELFQECLVQDISCSTKYKHFIETSTLSNNYNENGLFPKMESICCNVLLWKCSTTSGLNFSMFQTRNCK
jgi:hypothetical protein